MGFLLGKPVKVHVSDWAETMSQTTERGGFTARPLNLGESKGLLTELGYQMTHRVGRDQIWERRNDGK